MKIHESGLYVPEQTLGSGKVELFDERGKKKYEQPFDNYVSSDMITYQRHQSRYSFGFAHPKGSYNGYTHYYNYVPQQIAWNSMGYMPGDGPPLWPMNTLMLTTADHPIDTAERMVRGQTVGWANKQSPYSGSDSQRGVVNLVESVTSGRTYYRWVFDWPTHAANGTYQSIYWAGCHGNDSSNGLGVVAWLHQSNGYDNNYFTHGDTTSPGWLGSNWRYAMAVNETADLILVGGSHYLDGALYSTRPWDTADRISARNVGFSIGGLAIIGDEVFVSHRTTNDAGVRVYQASSATYSYTAGSAGTPLRTLDLDNAVMGQFMKIASNGTHLFAYCQMNPNEIRRYDVNGTLLGTIPLPAYISNSVQYYYLSGVKSAQPNYGILTLHPQADNSVKFTFMDSTRGWVHLAHVSATGQVISVHGAAGGSRPDWGYSAGGRVFAGYITLWQSNPSWTPLPNLGTRTRLVDPITKSNLQTMKITYQFDFADLG